MGGMMDNSVITASTVFTIFFVISFLGAIPILQIFFFTGYSLNVEGVEEISEELKEMDIDSMYRSVLHCQHTCQFRLGKRYMNSLDVPMAITLRGMATSEGLSLDF
jgi:hypothetical protein